MGWKKYDVHVLDMLVSCPGSVSQTWENMENKLDKVWKKLEKQISTSA